MRRAPESASDNGPVSLDPVQQAVLTDHSRALLVHGGPGTGKSTLAVEIVAAEVAAGRSADHCLVLAPGRIAAARLRDGATARVNGTSTQTLARSHQSFGFAVLRQAAALRGDPTPRLLTGPEQDVVLRDLLAGYAAGDAPGPDWPADLSEAPATRGFRAELRDLLMRAVEWGLDAPALRALGVQHARPEWVAAAHVLDDYDAVTAMSRPGAYDPSWILTAAADLLEDDPEALARVRDQCRLVVVDDAQELTHASARLLRVLVGPRTRVRLLTDPDSTAQGFRGSDPRLAELLAADWEAPATSVLPVSYRLPADLSATVHRIAGHIGNLGPASRREVTARPGGRTDVALLRSVAQEAQYIAGLLRRAHLIDGVAWSDQAVLVRGQGRTGALRRALASAGVPVAVPATSLPLRDEPAVRPFLTALELALSNPAPTAGHAPVTPRFPDHSEPADVAVDLLTSVLGGADAVSLRRLRRALRRDEIAVGGTRSSDELLIDAVVGPPEGLALVGPEAFPARRVARVVDAARQALAEAAAPGSPGAPAVEAEEVLWRMWQAAGASEAWEQRALDGGAAGLRADRDLDAVMALFAAAATHSDRLPGASVESFLEHVRSQDLPGDRLVDHAPDDEQVALLTPAAAAGRQWHTVVIAGVQEGVWPDLRLRGSLLGSEALVDVLAGRGTSWKAAQTAVRHDETRQFHVAVSRARERLVVTAVRSEDEQPSVYLDLVQPLEPADGADGEPPLRGFTDVPHPMSLAAVVADRRRLLGQPHLDPAQREAAARTLAVLARAGVAGADPANWWALTELTDDRPLRRPDQEVRLSPSQLESFSTCGLNWLLTTHGGRGPDLGAAQVGVLVHEIAAEAGDHDVASLHEMLDERWVRLGLGRGWISERKRAEAHRMLTNLHGYLRDAGAQGWEVVAVEEGFRVRVGRALLTGKVDRLERAADLGLRVVDLKTGGTKPTNDEVAEHAQLGAYQVAVRGGAFGAPEQPGGAALVQLGKAATSKGAAVQQQQPLDPENDWATTMVTESAEGMGAAHVTAVKGSSCRICPVRRCCPVQPEGGVL